MGFAYDDNEAEYEEGFNMEKEYLRGGQYEKEDLDDAEDEYTIGDEEEEDDLADELMIKASLGTAPATKPGAEETKTVVKEEPAKISGAATKVAQGEDDDEEIKVVKGKVGGTTVPVA
jgi:hypothetical protein